MIALFQNRAFPQCLLNDTSECSTNIRTTAGKHLKNQLTFRKNVPGTRNVLRTYYCQLLPSKHGNDCKLHKRILSLARCGSGPWGRARAPLHINARGLPQTHFASEQRRTQVTDLLSLIAFLERLVLTDDDDDEVFSRSSDLKQQS